MRYIFTLITIALLAGCGGGNSSAGDGRQMQQRDEDVALDTGAKRYFGYLADARVDLYELDGDRKNLLFSERTTGGDRLDAIGNFDPHLRDMTREKRYLYVVSGGESWDADHDGKKDAAPTPNTTTYRTVYQGYKIKVAWWGDKKSGDNRAPSEE